MTKTKQKNVLGTLMVGAGLFCALQLGPVRSDAAPVTFSFSGSVSNVLGGVFTSGGTGANGFSSALPLSGNFTFDSSTPDSNGGGNVGRYNGTLPNPQTLTVNVGTYQAIFSPGSSFIRVTNTPAGDRFVLRADGVLGNPVNGFAPASFRLELTDPSGSAFSGDALPTAPPSLSSFSSVQWRLVFDGAGRRVEGALTSLVPLPAAVWLFGAGLIALVGLGSRSLTFRKGAQP